MTNLPDAKLYIDGKLRDAEGGKTFDVISPWTGEVAGKAADASAADVDEAIAAARRAFDESDWAAPENRGHRLELVKKLLYGTHFKTRLMFSYVLIIQLIM